MSNVFYDEIERRLEERRRRPSSPPSPYEVIEGRLEERERARRFQLGTATLEDVLEARRRGQLIPGSLAARLLRSPAGRIFSRLMAGLGTGLMGGVLRAEPRPIVGEEAPPPPTAAETVAQTAGEMVGYVVGPGGAAFGAVARRAIVPAASAAGRRLAPALASAFRGTPLARFARQVAEVGGEGAVFAITDALVNEHEKLAQMDVPSAAAYLARRAGVTSAQWAAFGAPFIALAHRIRSTPRKAIEDAARRVYEPKVDPSTGDVLFPPGRPPKQIQDIYRIAPTEPPRPLQTVRVRRAPDGSWTTEVVRPNAPPRVSAARRAALQWLERATPEQVNAALFTLKAKPEQLGELLKGTRATGTNPRALGLNPRRLAEVAQEMGVSLEEARKAVLREVQRALREERGEAVIGPSGLLDMPLRVARRRTDVEAVANLAASVYHQHRNFETWSTAIRDLIERKAPGASAGLDLPRLFEIGRERYARLAVNGLLDRVPDLERVLELYRAGEGAAEWYAASGQVVKSLLAGDDDAARFMLGALAVLSEQQSVKGNVTRAITALYHYLTSRKFDMFPPHQAKKLEALATGADPAQVLGRKTYNFYRALDGDPNAVVVDRWMNEIFGLPRDKSPTDVQYDVIESIVRRWAEEVGLSPRDMQAVLWAGIRAKHSIKDPTTSFASVISANPAIAQRVRVFKRIAGAEPLPAPKDIVTRNDWVIIAHDNPAKPEMVDRRLFHKGETPQAAMVRALTDELKVSADNIVPTIGVWMGSPPEGGFLVRGLELGQAIRLARRFGQNSIMTPYGELNVWTLEVYPKRGTVFGEQAAAREGYTLIPGREPFSFEIDYGAPTHLTKVPELLTQVRSWRGILTKEQYIAALKSQRGEIGGRWPEEFEVLFDPQTGKYVAPPNSHEYVQAFVEELNRQANRAKSIHILRTGNPPAAMPPKLEGSTALQKVEEWATAIKLTNPLTYSRNIISNVAAMTFSPVESTVAGVVAGRGPREGLEMARGIVAALPGATRKFLAALKNELTVAGAQANELRLMEAGGRAIERGPAIGGAFGVRVRTPFRLLGITDEFFRQIVTEGAMYREAFRVAYKEGHRGVSLAERMADLLQHPTDEITKAAERIGREYTFTEDVGRLGQHLVGLREAIPGGRLLIPFLKTPINIARFFARRTPLGLLDRSLPLEDRIAKAAVGSVIGASLVMLAEQGYITGAGPKSSARRDALRATGWQPYSIRVGDKWISYRGLEPIGFFLSTAAAIAETDPDDKTLQAQAAALIQNIAKSLADATFVNSLSDVMDAIVEPDRYLGKYAQNIVLSATIPAAVSAVARTVDPTVRDPRTFAEAAAARIPGLSQTVRPKVDVFGREIQREGIPLFTPPMSTVRHDPVAEEIVRLGVVLPRPSKKTKEGERTADEILAIMKRRGEMYYDLLRRLVESPGYRSLSDDAKREVMRRWVRAIVRRTQEVQE